MFGHFLTIKIQTYETMPNVQCLGIPIGKTVSDKNIFTSAGYNSIKEVIIDLS